MSVDNVLHISGLDVLSRACEVLIGGLQPADIVVAVRDEMHEEVLVALGKLLLELFHPFAGVSVVQVLWGVGSVGQMREAANEGRLNQSRLHREDTILILNLLLNT